jgi:hypothetical protein
MKVLPSVLVALGAAIVASCSMSPTRLDAPALKPGWPDVGTPAPSMALEREARYYVDEKGVVWDDRGKKHDAAP